MSGGTFTSGLKLPTHQIFIIDLSHFMSLEPLLGLFELLNGPFGLKESIAAYGFMASPGQANRF